MIRIVFFFFLFFLVFSCGVEEPSIETKVEVMADSLILALPHAEAIQQRVYAAKDRLQQSEGGSLIWQAIEAHGGLQRWFGNGPLFFHFNYQPLKKGPARNTYEIADFWTSRTVHQMATDTTWQFGWDGEQAWQRPDTTMPGIVPRFWALTPYYFVGIPFVLADPGINYEVLKPDTLGGRNYDLVKITYEANVGDAPDDYYIIYVDQETKEVGAIRYIVTYFGKRKNSQEKLMKFDGQQVISGIKFPKVYYSYQWEESKMGAYVTKTELTEVDFRPETPNNYFFAPEGAKLIKSNEVK